MYFKENNTLLDLTVMGKIFNVLTACVPKLKQSYVLQIATVIYFFVLLAIRIKYIL
jgi:hypothetical protein